VCGALFPTEAFVMPDMPEFSREGIRFVVMGIITEKVDNTGVMMDLRGTSAVLPIRHAIFRNRQQYRYPLLPQAISLPQGSALWPACKVLNITNPG
jgi:hypothetical protein